MVAHTAPCNVEAAAWATDMAVACWCNGLLNKYPTPPMSRLFIIRATARAASLEEI